MDAGNYAELMASPSAPGDIHRYTGVLMIFSPSRHLAAEHTDKQEWWHAGNQAIVPPGVVPLYHSPEISVTSVNLVERNVTMSPDYYQLVRTDRVLWWRYLSSTNKLSRLVRRGTQ